MPVRKLAQNVELHPYVEAYCRMLGAPAWFIQQMLDKAELEQAPWDAIFYNGYDWDTFEVIRCVSSVYYFKQNYPELVKRWNEAHPEAIKK